MAALFFDATVRPISLFVLSKSEMFLRKGKNGRALWLQEQYIPILQGQNVVQVIEFATDVTREMEQRADFESQITAIRQTLPYASFGVDGQIVEANDAFLRTMGYSLSEIAGQHHRLFVEDPDSESYRQFWASLNEGKAIHGEFKRIGKNGKEVFFQATYTPILGASTGKLVKVVEYAIDITLQKEEIRNHDLLVESSFDAIISIDASGTILTLNSAGRVMFGFSSAEEVVGRNISVIMPEPHASYHNEYVIRYLKTRDARVVGKVRVFPALHQNGTELQVEVLVTEGKSTAGSIFFGILRDVTERTEQNRVSALDKEHLRALANCTTGDAVFTITTQGVIRSANSEASKIFGYSEREFVGQNITMLMAPEFAVKHQSFIDKYLASGKSSIIGVGRRLIAIAKSGANIPILLNVADAAPGSAADRFFVGVIRDMTAETRAEKAVDSQKRLLEGFFLSSLSMLTISPNGVIRSANSAACKTFGYGCEEMINQNVTMLMTLPESVEHDEYLRRYLRTNQPVIIGVGREVRGRKKDGTIFPLQLAVSEVRSNDDHFFTGILTDLTQQKASEKAKSQFLALMSHEIRTPLNGMFGMLSLLKSSALDATQRHFVETCSRSSEALLNVLNDVLVFSKAEADSLVLERIPFQLNSMIEDVMQIASGNVDKTSQEIDVAAFMKEEVPVWLVGDSSRLRQVLLNLIGNGIKFTRLGEVSLEVSVVTKEPFVLQFDINDTGIGLSAEQQKNLFKPFMQADLSTSRKYGGTGLGLAICKKLVELMGGKLWVNSRLGRGSTFSFTVMAPHVVVDTKISMEASPQAIFELTAADMKVFRTLRVAIIDDNATNCMALDALMQQCGVETHMSFRLGMDGINEMRASEMKGQPFNLLLLDYHMPLMDGIEVCNSLMRSLKKMPIIIALSSFLDHNLLSKVPGITACTSKPIRQQHLLYMICRSLMAPAATMLDQVVSPRNDSIGPAHSTDFDVCVSQFEGSFSLPKTVLVVEDNAVNQMVMCALLSAAEVKVLVANNGVEAVQMEAECKDIELILMDLHMPVLDGIQAAELLRRRGCKLPILAVTADITSEAKLRCAPLMQGFLMKPVQKMVLFEAMSRVWSASLSTKPRAATASSLAAVNVSAAAPAGLTDASFPAIPLILLADDAKTNIMFAEHLLKTGIPNCEIVSVEDGIPAVAATLVRKFDVIFLDLHMPGLSGIEAAVQIRGNASNPNYRTPIICITGDDDTDTVREINMAGMNGVIAKPFLEDAFLSAWNEHGRMCAPAAEVPLTVAVEIDPKVTESLPVELVTRLRAVWKSDVQLLMQALIAAIATESWKAAHTAAHTIKGSSAQVGAVTVSRMAAVLQMCSLQSEAKQKASLLDEAIAETSKRW